MGLFKRVPTPECKKQDPRGRLCGKCVACKTYKAATWWITFSDDRKLQRRESAHTTQRAEAERLLAARKQEIRNGAYDPDRKKTTLNVDGLRGLWLKHAERKKSLAGDRQRFEAIVEFFGATKLVVSMQPADIEALRDHLTAKTTRLGKPMAAATVNRHLAVLRAAIMYAGRNGYAHRSPMRGIKMLPEHNARDRICSPEEYAALIANAYPRLRLQ